VVKGGEFERLVERDFGGVEGLKKEVNAKTAAIQGSGWGWVVSLALWFLLWIFFLVSSLLLFVTLCYSLFPICFLFSVFFFSSVCSTPVIPPFHPQSLPIDRL
jgi:hypothetical protein